MAKSAPPFARRPRLGRSWLALAAAVAAFHASSTSHAQATDDVARARAVYDEGTRLYEAGDYARAAVEFARADSLAPSTIALDTALGAATLANDCVLRMTLSARAARAAPSASLDQKVHETLRECARRTGRLRISCAGASDCPRQVDGVSVERGSVVYVALGRHTVGAQDGSRVYKRDVEARADETVEVVLGEPQAAADRRTASTVPPSAGVSPGWFFAALAATAVLGVVSAVSARDGSLQHDAFVARGCLSGSLPGCAESADDGRSADLRTSVLLAVTAAAAVGTAGLGLFFVRWKAVPSSPVAVAVSYERSGGPVATLRYRF